MTTNAFTMVDVLVTMITCVAIGWMLGKKIKTCFTDGHLWVEDDDCSIHCDRCDVQKPFEDDVEPSKVKWL